MPNPNWSMKSRERARTKMLANNRIDEPDMLPYCRKCPVRKDCDCVQYDGYGMIDFWCADNPDEKREVIIGDFIWNRGFEVSNDPNVGTFPRLHKIALDNFKRIFPEGAKEIKERRRDG